VEAEVATAGRWVFDLARPELIPAAARDLPDIDILVNNAGVIARGPALDQPYELFREVCGINLDAVYTLSRAVGAGMVARGRGKIINIGSVQCELARPGIAPYTASKGAVKNLTKGMCADWARHGLQINAIGPGYFATPLNKALIEDPVFDEWLRKRTPAGRWGELADLHGAAVFLASDASNFINGQTIYVDGGILSVI
jgi:gluconate 5-dehydrogenase